jgi:hypothetical protein
MTLFLYQWKCSQVEENFLQDLIHTSMLINLLPLLLLGKGTHVLPTSQEHRDSSYMHFCIMIFPYADWLYSNQHRKILGFLLNLKKYFLTLLIILATTSWKPLVTKCFKFLILTVSNIFPIFSLISIQISLLTLPLLWNWFFISISDLHVNKAHDLFSVFIA